MEEECEVAYILATESYKTAIREMFSGRDNSPVESQELFNMFKQARSQGMKDFRVQAEVRDKFVNYPDYVDKLQNYINQQEDALIDINENISKQ